MTTPARPLLRHFVLFNFKDDARPEQREQLVTALRDLTRVPGCLSYDVAPRADLSGTPLDTREWLCAATFASQEDMERFDNDPTHQALGPMLFTLVKDIVAMDAVY